MNVVCRGAYLQLHNIRRIIRCSTQDLTKTVVHAFVTSKLDYENALFSGLPGNLLHKLQRVQNMAARIIMSSLRR